MNRITEPNPFRKSRLNDALIAELERSFARDSDLVQIVIHLRERINCEPLTDVMIGKISRRLQRKLNELLYGRNFLRNKKAIAFTAFHQAVPSNHLHIIAELPSRWMDCRFQNSQRTIKNVADCASKFCIENSFCEPNPYVDYVKDIQASVYYNNRSNANGRLVV
jgi:hypothetical protein